MTLKLLGTSQSPTSLGQMPDTMALQRAGECLSQFKTHPSASISRLRVGNLTLLTDMTLFAWKMSFLPFLLDLIFLLPFFFFFFFFRIVPVLPVSFYGGVNESAQKAWRSRKFFPKVVILSFGHLAWNSETAENIWVWYFKHSTIIAASR